MEILLFPVLPALVLFVAMACQECRVLRASRRSALLLGSEPVALCLPRGPAPRPEGYFADCSTGRTMISREPLLVKSG